MLGSELTLPWTRHFLMLFDFRISLDCRETSNPIHRDSELPISADIESWLGVLRNSRGVSLDLDLACFFVDFHQPEKTISTVGTHLIIVGDHLQHLETRFIVFHAVSVLASVAAKDHEYLRIIFHQFIEDLDLAIATRTYGVGSIWRTIFRALKHMSRDNSRHTWMGVDDSLSPRDCIKSRHIRSIWR